MNKKSIFVCILITLMNWIVVGAQIETDSQINRVTVYPNRAMITRTSKVSVGKGLHNIIFVGLSSQLLNDSVRVNLDSKDLKMIRFETREMVEKKFNQEDSRLAFEQLKQFKQALSSLEDQEKFIQDQIQLFKQLDYKSNQSQNGSLFQFIPINPSHWSELIQFQDQKLKELTEKIIQIQYQKQQLIEKIKVAEIITHKYESHQIVSTKEVELYLESSLEQEVAIEIQYFIMGPAWYPMYDIRGDVDSEYVELTMYAVVQQETSQNWSNIQLSLSMASPVLNANIPQLPVWKIQDSEQVVMYQNIAELEEGRRPSSAPYQEEAVDQKERFRVQKPKSQKISFKKNAAMGFGDSSQVFDEGVVSYKIDQIYQIDLTQKKQMQDNNYDQAIESNEILLWNLAQLSSDYQEQLSFLNQNAHQNISLAKRFKNNHQLKKHLISPLESAESYDYRYDVLQPVTIESDGLLTKFGVLTQKFPSKYFYEIAPSLSKQAYLTTYLNNSSSTPYLKGPANIFLGSNYIGETLLENMAPHESTKIYFGVDESIKVNRIQNETRDTSGVFYKDYQWDYQIKIEVDNEKPYAIQVHVYDLIPFTFNEEIKVDIVQVKPNLFQKHNEGKGLCEWRLQIPQHSKDQVEYQYRIISPADMKLEFIKDSSVKW